MKKTVISRAKPVARKAAAKASPKRLVAVKNAAQKPTHATRAAIRRAVRAVTTERPHADA
ncbi:MAG: hypothetical protein IRY87_03670 [Acetobacteraceae bacterium]|nr:hypothetical protein [Acetobacteraceae bacterium]